MPYKKKLLIYIDYKDPKIGEITIGEVSYYTIKKESLYYAIDFENCTFYSDISFQTGDRLYLRENSRSLYLSIVDIYEAMCVKKGTIDRLTIKFELDSFFNVRYSRFYLKLMRSVCEGKDIYDWRSLSNFRKRVWIHVSLGWSGIQTVYESNSVIEFDCNEVNCKLDLFCYLGELFFGKYGYLGQDLDGLIDCIRTMEKGVLTIVFKNYSHLEDVLNTEKSFKKYKNKYTEILLDCFSCADFVVKVD